jgi:hypothetical protein
MIGNDKRNIFALVKSLDKKKEKRHTKNTQQQQNKTKQKQRQMEHIERTVTIQTCTSCIIMYNDNVNHQQLNHEHFKEYKKR